MALISVIIPAYNAQSTIQETIESVLEQTFTDFELIVVNDGSQDSTLEIISSIQDSRIKVFSYDNAGASAGRNRGFAQSQGKFIAFLDADDLWTKDKLESQLVALQNNPQADIAYSWSDCIDENSQFLRRGGYAKASGNIYPQLLLLDILENGSNPLIHRQAIIDVNGFDESLAAGQDWDFYLRLAINHEFILVPYRHILYRIYNQSMSANVWRLETAGLEVITRAFNQAPASLQYLKKDSVGNLYKYLVVKALEGIPDKKKCRAATSFLWQAIKQDHNLIRQKITFKVLLKAALVTILTSGQASKIFAKFQQTFDTTTIMGYLRLNPSQNI